MALHIGGLTRLGGDRARRSVLAARVQRTVKAIIAATKRDVGAELEVEITAPTILEFVCDDPDRLDISATAPPTKLTFGGAVPRPPTNRPTELMRRCDAGWSSQSKSERSPRRLSGYTMQFRRSAHPGGSRVAARSARPLSSRTGRPRDETLNIERKAADPHSAG